MSFKDIFNIEAEVKESAHARVNLIGEHTDYTGGYVMPTLLSFKNTIEISNNNSNVFTVYSQHFKEKKTFNDLDPKGGIVYTGNSDILKEVCPGDFGKINKQGFCMIGVKIK